MNKEIELVNRELLSASIAYIEAVDLGKANRGRGIKGGIEKAKLALLRNDARIRLVKAQNESIALSIALLRREAGK